ncbi:hypothetical protein SASPL_148950 [Salvia splendens]|uniref:Reverse transcriptase Ty1/copia-type domain-containing protein n=1 Tax=Salvia splendens TaxID=180675 RepID=A0A8X8Z3W5_SALSN|nr:hypothetical protein SASPL_148950 [Salvia splendens]
MISDFKSFLTNHFKFKDLGKPKYFLGIEIARNETGIFISQHKYALDLVTDAGLLGCKPASTPMDSTMQLQMDAGDPLPDPTIYRRLIGRLVRKGSQIFEGYHRMPGHQKIHIWLLSIFGNFINFMEVQEAAYSV